MLRAVSVTGDKMNYDNKELDMLAVAASKSDVEFERLLTLFKPFLQSQVLKQMGRYSMYRDDMMSAAMMAFH